MNIVKANPIFVLFCIALILRLSFSFYFQQFYFGEFTWSTTDTNTTYLNPFLNLINNGQYMGDMYLEDSRYYAVPVYPFFIGSLHYIFGTEHVVYTIAFFQSILGALSTVFIYKIMSAITNSNNMALISALIFATYPFEIIWSPIGVTETMYVFFALLLVYVIIRYKINTLKMAFITGNIIGIATLTKQHLGPLLIIPIIIILFQGMTFGKWKKKIVYIAFVFIGFGTVLSPWIVRNYIHSGKLIILKGETVGIRGYGLDFRAFEKFANLFNQNITPLVDEVVKNGTLTLNKHSKFVKKHKKEIQKAAYLAHNCGPAFVERRISTKGGAPYKNGCEKEVIMIFNKLTDEFWEEVPFYEAIGTRIDAIKKVYIKSDIVKKKFEFSKTDFIKKALFFYRTILLTLGLIGMIWLYRVSSSNFVKSLILGIAAYSFFIYFYIAVIMLHVEIRYVLLPDIFLSIFASVTIVNVITVLKNKKVLLG